MMELKAITGMLKLGIGVTEGLARGQDPGQTYVREVHFPGRGTALKKDDAQGIRCYLMAGVAWSICRSLRTELRRKVFPRGYQLLA